jgi:hypothetical protein
MTPLSQLRNLARGKVHGGYRWAAVCADGELLCVKCVRENYRQVYANTKMRPSDWPSNDWRVKGITHSGEHEGPAENCAHCGVEIFEAAE